MTEDEILDYNANQGRSPSRRARDMQMAGIAALTSLGVIAFLLFALALGLEARG